MLKKHLIFFVIIFTTIVNTPFLNAEENYKNYIFPFKKSNGRITGSFAEQRGLRFHAGIDFSTDNKTGYTILSIDNAIIYRIKTSPGGYGKALYLKLDDGNIVVYAHLSDFSEKINNLIRPIQEKNKSFWLNRYFTDKNIRIKKGEVIGFSGDSGGSSPHLHFEIRDSEDKPFNLLNKSNILTSDFFKGINSLNKNAEAKIKNIFLIPANKNSYINGKNEIFKIIPKRKKDFSYYIKENISIYGQIIIGVQTYEEVAGNKIGPKNIALKINDQELYRIDLNNFAYTQYNYSGLIYSLNLKQEGFKNTFLLMQNTDYSLPFTKKYIKGKGIIDTDVFDSNTPIKTVIDITSSTGKNKTNLFFTLHKVEPQIINIKKHSLLEQNQLNIKIDTKDLTKTAQLEISTLYDTKKAKWKILKNIQFDGTKNIIEVNHTFTDIPKLLKIEARDKKGALHSPFIIKLKKDKKEQNSKIEIDHKDNLVNISITSDKTSLTKPLGKLTLNSQTTNLDFIPKGFQTYSTNIYTDSLSDDKQEMEVTITTQPGTENEKVLNRKFRLHPITTDKNHLISSDDKQCYVKASVNALFDKTYIAVTSLNENFVKKHIPEKIKLSPLSAAYSITPKDMLVRKKIQVGIKCKPEDLPFAGVYYLLKDKWIFDGKNDTSGNFVESNTRVGGVYCLLKDNHKPIIKNINPIHDKKDYVKIPLISAVVYDKESGLDDSRTELFLNGQKCAAEYDKNKEKIFFRPTKLIPGTNSVTVKVADNIGNENEKTFTFSFTQGLSADV